MAFLLVVGLSICQCYAEPAHVCCQPEKPTQKIATACCQTQPVLLVSAPALNVRQALQSSGFDFPPVVSTQPTHRTWKAPYLANNTKTETGAWRPNQTHRYLELRRLLN